MQIASAVITGPPIDAFTTTDSSKDIILGPGSTTYQADFSTYSNWVDDVHTIAGYHAASGGAGWADIQHEDQAGLWSSGPYTMLGRGASGDTAWVAYKFATDSGYVTDAGGTITAHFDFRGRPDTQGNDMWIGVNDTMTLGIVGGELFNISNAGDFDKVTMYDKFPSSAYDTYNGDITINIPTGVNEFYVVLADATNNSGYMAYTSLDIDAQLIPEPATVLVLGVGFGFAARIRKR